MDKNFFLAIFLSVLVYIGWFTLVEKKRPRPVREPAPPAAAGERSAPTTAAGGPARAVTPSLSPAQPDPAPAAGGLDGAMTFNIGGMELMIQPLGAAIVSYSYPGPLGPVDLIADPYPGFFATWPELRFTRAGGDKNWPAFDAVHASGAQIRKEYLFQSPHSINSLRLTITNPGKEPLRLPAFRLALGPGLGTVPTEQKENSAQWQAVALLPSEKAGRSDEFVEFKNEEETVAHEGEWRWLGIQNRYFLSAIFPADSHFGRFEHGTRKKMVMTKSWLGQTKRGEALAPWLNAEASALDIGPGETVKLEIPFYFGPKGYSRLKAIGQGLERSVSFGWFHRLGRFTLYVLSTFHSWTNNWGWSIILLTICLQIIMFPLTYKSTKSMVMMKKVAPEQAKLQQKFKGNPQRLNQEMMALYKRHNVNPLGGCLPMLAQMPIFIALFNMLRNAWELHGAPWMLWVQDLSAADPYYVLPVVMGGIMFLQNKMTPVAGGDPNQAKMMQFMPIIFTFMFLNFPAGLVLYWLTNSILSFAQQLIIKRQMGA
ncbi:MAG: membrane protein insertase YidC [Elusimicrobiota bacterium]